MLKKLGIKSASRTEVLDITGAVREVIRASGAEQGLCSVYVPHTTAGILINEGADPDVNRDILKTLQKLIPFEGGYAHSEGNSAAHIKAVLTGTSQTLIIEKGRPLLGTWQSVFFCEFDGPRRRQIFVKVISDI